VVLFLSECRFYSSKKDISMMMRKVDEGCIENIINKFTRKTTLDIVG
jgi:hypothetical protein